MAEKLTELFQCMWRKEAIPHDFKDASIIHLYKRNGNPQVGDNHRGISLLSIAGKNLAKILLNRLNTHLDQAGHIPESQCGFRKAKVQTDVFDKLLYADDLAENAKSEEKMQGAVDRMSKPCDNFQLTISTKKTEVVHKPAPGKPYSAPTITVNGQKLQVVDKFTYLGSTLSRAVHIDDEYTARTAKASVAFGSFRTNVWERNGIRLDTKLKVYKADVLPTLL